MKFIGQYIQSFIARFRNDVYLEDVSTGTIASGGNLGLDSNNKIVKATEATGDITGVEAGTGLSGGGTSGSVTLNVSGLTVSEIAAGSILVAGETFADNDTSLMSAAAINDRIESFGYTANTGDITGVDLTGTSPINIGSETGTTSGDYSANITVDSASTTNKGVVELATTAETTTGTDVDRAVTPDGLKDGYRGSTNVVTVGTIATGEWRGTAINATYLDGQSGTNTGDETLARINNLEITTVGTISSGEWRGTAIATAYIADDAVTEDKLANTLLAEIDANTAKVTNVVTNLDQINSVSQLKITSSDGGDVTIAEASGSIAGVMTVAHHDKLDGIETGATADQSNAEILTAIEDGVDSVHYVDGSIDTAHIADDQVTFAKALGVTPNVFGSVIKLIPSDFMDNGDGGNQKFGVAYTDVAGTGYGMRPANNATELYAFVSIPEGMKAVSVHIYDKNDLAIEVFEAQIDATTMTSKGTGNCGTTLTLSSEVNSSDTNFLAIEVTTTSVNDRVYGGIVTIAAQ